MCMIATHFIPGKWCSSASSLTQVQFEKEAFITSVFDECESEIHPKLYCFALEFNSDKLRT